MPVSQIVYGLALDNIPIWAILKISAILLVILGFLTSVFLKYNPSEDID
ncbi:hypothetical protein [Metaclostridioides mangenotii]|nr:hypothetical protein [Clostridioides mangenotii]